MVSLQNLDDTTTTKYMIQEETNKQKMNSELGQWGQKKDTNEHFDFAQVTKLKSYSYG